MINPTFRTGLALLALLAAFAAPAHAVERPFFADGSGARQLFPSPFLGASGQATHLGQYHLLSDLNHFRFNMGEIAVDNGLMEAADGDFLFVTISAFDIGDGMFLGIVTFDGGTGQFEFAAGEAQVLFLFDENLVRFDLFVTGTIDY